MALRRNAEFAMDQTIALQSFSDYFQNLTATMFTNPQVTELIGAGFLIGIGGTACIYGGTKLWTFIKKMKRQNRFNQQKQPVFKKSHRRYYKTNNRKKPQVENSNKSHDTYEENDLTDDDDEISYTSNDESANPVI